MSRIHLLACWSMALWLMVFACTGTLPGANDTREETLCVIETTQGTMTFRFFETDAPLHCAHFRTLVQAGFYDGKTFYRVVKGHVIQAGDGEGTAGPTVRAEFNARPHITGTVGMARDEDPDSGSTEFYICLAPRPHLDGKYTVFGQLVDGYDVLEKIGHLPVNERFVGEERKVAFHEPQEPLVIRKVTLQTRPAE
ncbi:MAG: peptidylprolyl isomerase [Acidobacteria bacterium]|nr:peptidylprolyl isomerase [Acidobacteriota bacterium]